MNAFTIMAKELRKRRKNEFGITAKTFTPQQLAAIKLIEDHDETTTAQIMGISIKTVQQHLLEARRKTGLDRTTRLVAKCVRAGIV